jgi:hypothetical protein
MMTDTESQIDETRVQTQSAEMRGVAGWLQSSGIYDGVERTRSVGMCDWM